MSNEIPLMREIANLQEQINALRTIEVGGVWQDWTPTVTYAGGTTDPTNLVLSAYYSVIGKICIFTVTGTLTRGSGDRAYIAITLPINYSVNFSGNVTVNFGSLMVCPNYGTAGSRLTINNGGMTADGYLWASGFYRIS